MHRSSLTRLRHLVFATTAASVVAAGLLTAVPASAAYYASTITPGMRVRSCVNTASAACGQVATTTSTGRMQCWRDGSWADGNYSSNRWFLMELSNGQEGFVHSSFVTNQVSVPNCDTLVRVRAADWALGQVGRVYAPTADLRPEFVWAPGPTGEWSGDCAKLPYLAYLHAGMSYPLANAIDQWQAFKNAGKARYDRFPRYGDPVFTSIAPYGHTGLYVGGQSMVGTQGVDNKYLPVQVYSMIDRYPTYLGWARHAAS
ncbi:hypothetical protein [Kribbella sp. VKM Ac-2566]|uniref:hypothetical protein n=1 Tax=Kribbella sp. VKM Ac-2566 TaxID=2512218 RepID=UPI0010635D8E|nr:hypothetical protein [Kribbella sp. VKM Ac-2566]TDW98254.1 hypothetical protein EV647_2959 [Kribbella sp. VKM Ac-2566]